MTRPFLRRLRRHAARLKSDTWGVALLEFAFAMPLVLSLGCYGIELSHLAWTHLKVSQIALSLADNASRVGVSNGLSLQQMREVDINDVLQAVRLQGASIDIAEHGRVTLSSLETDDDGVQRIHWQRCVGKKSGTGYDSSYGTTQPTDGIDTDSSTADNSASHPGTEAPDGMGKEGAKVSAPANFGVMFVEINYDYQPLFGTMLLAPTKLHYMASFTVRDRRDFTQVYNPTPTATRATCDLHTA